MGIKFEGRKKIGQIQVPYFALDLIILTPWLGHKRCNAIAYTIYIYISDRYGWKISDKLWNISLRLIKEEDEFNSTVQKLMLSSRTIICTPKKALDNPLQADCLHFCMNSALQSIYILICIGTRCSRKIMLYRCICSPN